MWASRCGGTGEAPPRSTPDASEGTGGTAELIEAGATPLRYDAPYTRWRGHVDFRHNLGHGGYLELQGGELLRVPHQCGPSHGEISGWAYGHVVASGIHGAAGWFPQRVLQVQPAYGGTVGDKALLTGGSWTSENDLLGATLPVFASEWVVVSAHASPDQLESDGWAYGRVLGDPSKQGWVPRRLLADF